MLHDAVAIKLSLVCDCLIIHARFAGTWFANPADARHDSEKVSWGDGTYGEAGHVTSRD